LKRRQPGKLKLSLFLPDLKRAQRKVGTNMG